jgi:hypothetical protein
MNYINNFNKPKKANKAKVGVAEEVGIPNITEELPIGSSQGEIVVKHNHRLDYVEYLEGDSWRCTKSPSRAHHWIVGNKTICKYCLKAKPPEIDRFARNVNGFTTTK